MRARASVGACLYLHSRTRVHVPSSFFSYVACNLPNNGSFRRDRQAGKVWSRDGDGLQRVSGYICVHSGWQQVCSRLAGRIPTKYICFSSGRAEGKSSRKLLMAMGRVSCLECGAGDPNTQGWREPEVVRLCERREGGELERGRDYIIMPPLHNIILRFI